MMHLWEFEMEADRAGRRSTRPVDPATFAAECRQSFF
jgi:hypothetical protein